MNLDLTDAEALTQELAGIVNSGRYPLPPRIQVLRAVLDDRRRPARRAPAAAEMMTMTTRPADMSRFWPILRHEDLSE